MSKELMKPRYLVIADYPDALWSPNDILSELHNERMVLTKGGFIDKPSAYPDIFRPLLWWEFRDEKEMPEYVKCIKTPDQKHFPGMVYKVDNWNAVFPTDQHGDAIILDTNCYLPATLEEYESFTKK